MLSDLISTLVPFLEFLNSSSAELLKGPRFHMWKCGLRSPPLFKEKLLSCIQGIREVPTMTPFMIRMLQIPHGEASTATCAILDSGSEGNVLLRWVVFLAKKARIHNSDDAKRVVHTRSSEALIASATAPKIGLLKARSVLTKPGTCASLSA